MTLYAELTKTQQDEYFAVLRTGYLQRTQVDFLDTDGGVNAVTARVSTNPGDEPPEDGDPRSLVTLVGGEVQMDLDADISRTCTLVLSDPAGKVRYAPRDSHDWAVYVGRMVQVTFGVYLPIAGVWADVPVFTGPVTKLERSGDLVGLDCAGKEWFLLEPFLKWRTMHWGKDAAVVTVMLQILRDQGERRFRGFPANPTKRLGKPYAIARWESPWPNLRRLAQLAGDKLIHYSGDGACVLRSKSTTSQWDFTQGKDVLGTPTFTWDLERLRNAVVVQWSKQDKKQPPEIAILGKDEKLSAVSLARNTRPLFMASLVDSQENKANDAQRLAGTLLGRASITPVECSFDALPVPHLEEYMRCALVADGVKTLFTLRQWTLGLLPGSAMSINVNTDAIRKRVAVTV